MQTPSTQTLSRCEGFHVLADDGLVGEVERALVPAEAAEPDYLVVRIRRRAWARWPVVPMKLVGGADVARRVIWINGSRADIAALPEHVPVEL